MVATPLHCWVNGDAAFEFLGFDMPVLRKQLTREALSLPILKLGRWQRLSFSQGLGPSRAALSRNASASIFNLAAFAGMARPQTT